MWTEYRFSPFEREAQAREFCSIVSGRKFDRDVYGLRKGTSIVKIQMIETETEQQ